jgi:hypothetical protein
VVSIDSWQLPELDLILGTSSVTGTGTRSFNWTQNWVPGFIYGNWHWNQNQYFGIKKIWGKKLLE